MSNTEIHILNVGHGDCTVIRHATGRITMVDINNGKDLDPTTKEEFVQGNVVTPQEAFTKELIRSITGRAPEPWGDLLFPIETKSADLTNPVEYFSKRFAGQNIWRFVLTHPDMDHIRGLSALLASGVRILNFWDTGHEIEKPSFWRTGDAEDWAAYQKLRSGSGGAKVFRPQRNDRNKYWNQDDDGGGGDGLWILAPTPGLTARANELGDPNAHSVVLYLEAHGTRVILGGDATINVQEDILTCYGERLRAHIYKAAHHGRDSGYHLGLLNAIQPEHTIVSVGKKPETDAQSKYAQQARKWDGKVLSTRFNGDIVVNITGQGIYTVNGEKSRLSPAPPSFQAALLRNHFAQQ
jgi:competence protein ComEC